MADLSKKTLQTGTQRDGQKVPMRRSSLMRKRKLHLIKASNSVLPVGNVS